MLPLSGAVKIYYCKTPVSLRKSFDGLAGAVRQYLQADPLSGHLFVFFNRTRKMVKILYWDRDGFAVWSKRLERGHFNIFKTVGEKIELSPRELYAILSGIKPQRYYKRYSL